MKKFTLWLAVINCVSMVTGYALIIYIRSWMGNDNIRESVETIGVLFMTLWVFGTPIMVGAIMYEWVQSKKRQKLVTEKANNLNQVIKAMDGFAKFLSQEFKLDMLWEYFINYVNKEDEYYNSRMFCCTSNKRSNTSFTLCQVNERIILWLPYGTVNARENKSIDIPLKITLGQFKQFVEAYGFKLEWKEPIKEKYLLTTSIQTSSKQ